MEETQPKNLFLRRARSNWIELAESPVQLSPKSQTKENQRASPSKGLSPMSVLAQDLSSANLADSTNMKRRLSLCSQSGSPAPSPLQHMQRRHKDAQDANVSFDSLPRSPLCGQNSDLEIPDKENSASYYSHFPKGSPKSRPLLEPNSDLNFQDIKDDSAFTFAQPNRMQSLKNTPQKENSSVHGSPKSSGIGLFRCLSSGSESIDDGFLEFLVDKENNSLSPSVPSGMGSLLSGQIVQRSPLVKQSSPFNCKSSVKRSLHRSLSVNDFDTPTSAKGGFLSPSFNNFQEAQSSSMEVTLSRPFKRPEPISENQDESHPPSKKRRNLSPLKDNLVLLNKNDNSPLFPTRGALTQSSLLNYGFQKNKSPASGKFQRSLSDTDAIIKNSVERSSIDSLLVGDFSRSFVLPLINGKHSDLKTISSETLASLLSGDYESHIDSFSIVDCRYPYEYNGGHIKGSQNLFTRDHITNIFIKGQNPSLSSNKRNVLIFHCEFSSERAPCLSRFLRNTDRQMNKECYPQLFYPEVYLLHGGYKAFYEAHPQLCEPRGYTPMLNQGNEADLRHFRAKSRSWAGDIKQSTSRIVPSNFNLKRLDV